jgi:hypothetical protein
MPVDACSSQKITAEFVDNESKSVTKINFTFDEGKLVRADAWTDTFEAGPLTDAQHR